MSMGSTRVEIRPRPVTFVGGADSKFRWAEHGFCQGRKWAKAGQKNKLIKLKFLDKITFFLITSFF